MKETDEKDFMNQLKPLIDKELPKWVGSELSKRLENYDKALLERDQYQSWWSRKNEEYDELKTKIVAFEEKEEAIKGQEAALKDKEESLKEQKDKLNAFDTKMALTLANIKLEEAEKRADMVMNFTSTLVRNNTFKKRILDEHTMPGHYDKNNNWTEDKVETQEHTETLSTEDE